MNRKFGFTKHAQTILTFKKWGRKNYSLFLVLKKTVRISVLAVSYILATSDSQAQESTDTLAIKMVYDLDEIEVTAQRTPALYSQVARIVSVIERKEIEAAPVSSVTELLEYVAGVDVRQRGQEGVQADVSIRGGTFDQTLVLLNGINITDPQTGHHNFNLPVSLDQVERIEILQGPAARVYGPNAFSGAINIVTRARGDKSIRTHLGAGSYGFLKGNMSGTFQTGSLDHLIAVDYSRSDGYINNTDFSTANLFYSNNLDVESGRLHFQTGYTEKGFGANSFYTPRFPDQYEETKTLLGSVKWQSNNQLHLTPGVYWRRHQDRFELFRDEAPEWYTTHNYHLTHVYGANLNSWMEWDLGKTALGMEYRSENINSNVLGTEMDEPIDVPGENAQFTKSSTRNTTSVFMDHTAFVKKWIFNAGVMANHISGTDLGLNFFPGIDISHQFNSNLKWFSTFNTSLRLPTFTDLYYSGPSNIGNPELKPEKSATIETGLKWMGESHTGHLVLFYRKGNDIIDWVRTSEGEIWQPRNLTELKNRGLELNWMSDLQRVFGMKHTAKLQLSYLYNNLQKVEMDYISNYVLDNLKHKFTAHLNQYFTSNLSLDLRTVFQDREGSYTEYGYGNWGSEIDYPPFWLLDAKVNYDWNKLKFYVSAQNLMDKSYYDIGNVEQPGRWFKAGLIYQVNFK